MSHLYPPSLRAVLRSAVLRSPLRPALLDRPVQCAAARRGRPTRAEPASARHRSTRTAPGARNGSHVFACAARVAADRDPNLAQGAQPYLRWRMRDPHSPSTTGVSNDLALVLCPSVRRSRDHHSSRPASRRMRSFSSASLRSASSVSICPSTAWPTYLWVTFISSLNCGTFQKSRMLSIESAKGAL